jgi:hypothetical protein
MFDFRRPKTNRVRRVKIANVAYWVVDRRLWLVSLGPLRLGKPTNQASKVVNQQSLNKRTTIIRRCIYLYDEFGIGWHAEGFAAFYCLPLISKLA